MRPAAAVPAPPWWTHAAHLHRQWQSVSTCGVRCLRLWPRMAAACMHMQMQCSCPQCSACFPLCIVIVHNAHPRQSAETLWCTMKCEGRSRRVQVHELRAHWGSSQSWGADSMSSTSGGILAPAPSPPHPLQGAENEGLERGWSARHSAGCATKVGVEGGQPRSAIAHVQHADYQTNRQLQQ